MANFFGAQYSVRAKNRHSTMFPENLLAATSPPLSGKIPYLFGTASEPVQNFSGKPYPFSEGLPKKLRTNPEQGPHKLATASKKHPNKCQTFTVL